MRRRELIALLGGAAAWPLAARAQQGEPVRRIGLLLAAPAADSEYPTLVNAFLQQLQELGWVAPGPRSCTSTQWS
jgi:putative ABC transport system substrate-binding protein